MKRGQIKKELGINKFGRKEYYILLVNILVPPIPIVVPPLQKGYIYIHNVSYFKCEPTIAFVHKRHICCSKGFNTVA